MRIKYLQVCSSCATHARKALSLVAVITLASVFTQMRSPAQTAKPDAQAVHATLARLTDTPWLVGQKASLEKLLADPMILMRVLQEIDSNKAPRDVDFSVGAYSFHDLLGDGWLELLVPIDASERGFYSTLEIVWQDGNTLKTQEIDGWNLNPVKVVQLSRDGQSQIVVPMLMKEYAGATPVPIFPHIYAWNGKRFVRSDHRFKSYYTDVVLPGLQKGLQEREGFQDAVLPGDIALWTKVYNEEIAAVQALIHTSK